MKEQKRHIDDFFREELGNFAETPPASAWDALEERLDEQSGRKRPLIFWWLLLLLPVIIGSAAALYYWNKAADHDMSAPKTTSIAHQQVATHPSSVDNTQKTAPVTKTTQTLTTPANANNPMPGNTPTSDTHSGINQDIPESEAQSATTVAAPAKATDQAMSQETNFDNSASKIRVQTDDGKGGDNTRALANASPTATKPKIQPYGRINAATSETASTPATQGDKSRGNRMRVSVDDKGTSAPSPVPARSSNADLTATENALEGAQEDHTAEPKATEAKSPAAPAATSSEKNKPATQRTKVNIVASAAHSKPAKQNSPSRTPKHTAAVNNYSSSPIPSKTTQSGSAVLSAKPNTATKRAPIPDSIASRTPTPTVKAAGAKKASQAKQQAQPVSVALSDTAHNNTGKPSHKKTADKQPRVKKIVTQSLTTAAHKPAKAVGAKKKVAKAAIPANNNITIPQPLPVKQQHSIQQHTAVNTKKSNAQLARDNPRLFNPRYVDTVESNKNAAAKRDSFAAAKAKEDSIAAAAAGSGTGGSPKIPFERHISAGVKAGYERGAGSYTAGKIVAGGYVKYPLSSKLALSVQPAAKFANTNSANTKPYGNYYDIKSMNVVKVYKGGGLADFNYSQTYDSLVVSTSAPRRYLEIEIPLMLQYQIGPRWELSGGLNLVFGKLINVSPEITRLTGYSINQQITGVSDTAATPAPPSAFSHGGSTPFSSYSYPPQSANSSLRIGYVLGIDYMVDERISLGVMVQQSLWSTNSIPNTDIKGLINQQYYRVSVGYQLFKAKKKAPATPAQP